jgi:hypothetical protein
VYSRELATETPRAYIVPTGGLSALDEQGKSKLAAELVAWVEENVRDQQPLFSVGADSMSSDRWQTTSDSEEGASWSILYPRGWPFL